MNVHATVLMNAVHNQLQGEILLVEKEPVLDMLYIANANEQLPTWALKVYEKTFESLDKVFVPGTNPQAVSMSDTIDFCEALAVSSMQLAERYLQNEIPLTEDMVVEYDALKSSGAEECQLGQIKKEIESRLSLIEAAKTILEIANEFAIPSEN